MKIRRNGDSGKEKSLFKFLSFQKRLWTFGEKRLDEDFFGICLGKLASELGKIETRERTYRQRASILCPPCVLFLHVFLR